MLLGKPDARADVIKTTQYMQICTIDKCRLLQACKKKRRLPFFYYRVCFACKDEILFSDKKEKFSVSAFDFEDFLTILDLTKKSADVETESLQAKFS